MPLRSLWKRSQPESNPPPSSLTWDAQAEQALNQALAQAPVPAMMKSMVKTKLQAAAEEHTKQAGRTTVTAEDLVQAMLATMPAAMKSKVADALKKGPAGLADLQNQLKQ